MLGKFSFDLGLLDFGWAKGKLRVFSSISAGLCVAVHSVFGNSLRFSEVLLSEIILDLDVIKRDFHGLLTFASSILLKFYNIINVY